MKKWICLLVCLLLLSGCGKKEAASMDRPYDLEIEYGDSGVTAMMGTYSWSWDAGDVAACAEDPLAMLSDIPYVNQSKASELKLLFAVEPDQLEIRYWTNADGYSEQTPVSVSGMMLPAPVDGANYLFEITASWEQTEQTACWGTCDYYFRYLPAGDTGEAENISMYRLLQLEGSDLFAVEVFNNLENAQKTCRSGADKEAILDFLKTNLATDFVQTQVPTVESDFVLRLASTDGSQLTVGYVSAGEQAWLLLGGVPYEAQPMDLQSLWDGLRAETVSLKQETTADYLQTSEEFPGADWGGDFVYGYLRGLDSAAAYDEILWIEDGGEPNGYRLEAGETGQSLPLAPDCQFWILEEHYKPYCQVTEDALWQWAETTGWDVLFQLYCRDGQVVAICEQYRP